jgi:hypothetical protein
MEEQKKLNVHIRINKSISSNQTVVAKMGFQSLALWEKKQKETNYS